MSHRHTSDEAEQTRPHAHQKKNPATLPFRIAVVLLAISLVLAWIGGFRDFWFYPTISAAMLLAWGIGVAADLIFSPKERPHGSGTVMLWLAVGITSIVIFYQIFMVLVH